MIFKANASINLALDVGERGENGYHDVDLISIPLDLHDVIEVRAIVGSRDTYLTEDDPTLICEETEMAYKAFAELRKRFKLNRGIRIQIYKRIPSEAGLGGGYADAACLIRALCYTYRIPLDNPMVQEVCQVVGSGVNLAMAKIAARATGTREIVEPLNDLNLNYGVLLVKPREGIDTKTIYERYDQIPAQMRHHPNIAALLNALRANDEEAIATNMGNSLLDPAIEMCPEIRTILDKMSEMGLPLHNMSSSGSACFCLSHDKLKLKEARDAFDMDGYATLLTSTVLKR